MKPMAQGFACASPVTVDLDAAGSSSLAALSTSRCRIRSLLAGVSGVKIARGRCQGYQSDMLNATITLYECPTEV